MITNWSFRFHDVLDANMLHQSLEELISKGENWAKLGGRFRLNVSKIGDDLNFYSQSRVTDHRAIERWKARASYTS